MATRTITTRVAAGVLAVACLTAAAAAGPHDATDGASTTAAATIGAPAVWAGGHTGDGVGIALIDTGVSPRPTLQGAIAAEVDTSAARRRTDGHGHGTFLAGLLAGQDGPDGPTGVAPDAHVVSFKVADAQGRTSLDRLMAAFGAVDLLADELNIRVVVLALGGPADDVPDPIEQALEQLWAAGLTVVVASGNDAGGVTEPGVSPYLLTVGATDDQGTVDRSDDELAAWSGRGAGRDGQPKPDVAAPGTSVVSVRVPGSTADREHPGSRIGGQWFRGSGTSMSAAVTAGAAALLLDAHPELTPDEVKGRLMASTSGDPAGTIDVPSALAADGAVANGHLAPIERVEREAPDDADLQPVAISSRWNGHSWIGHSWIDSEWAGHSWIGHSWIGHSWIGHSWIELEWDGHSWIGHSWIDGEWAESSWAGHSWIGHSWIDHGWTGISWTGVSWASR